MGTMHTNQLTVYNKMKRISRSRSSYGN